MSSHSSPLQQPPPPSIVVTPPPEQQQDGTPLFLPNHKRSEHKEKNQKILSAVRDLYGLRTFLLEPHFVAVTKTCGLPRYMNIALFRRIDSMNQQDERISYDQFAKSWMQLSQSPRCDDDSLFFNILKRPGCAWLHPEDFLPVLEDIVLNHPGLQFLADNPMFQERYIETVICRLYYDARCPGGKMSLSQFKRCQFTRMINALSPGVDLNSTRDCFSYKHFYVLYCKFWTLDDDHDLTISESNLAHYNQSALTPRAVHRIMQCGRIAAFARDQGDSQYGGNPKLTYLDYIWFLLSEVDKSTPMAIEYWFRCLDTDGDGVLSGYELSQFWEEQEARQYSYGISDEDRIKFSDILRQMNDLIQPDVPNQFRLRDLKRNGFLAERFFDTFLNFDRLQIHESYQGSIRAKRNYELGRRRSEDYDQLQLSMLDDSLDCFVLSDWCDFAEAEYHQLLLSEHSDSVWDDQSGDEEGDGEEVEDDDDDDDDDDEEEEEEEEEIRPAADEKENDDGYRDYDGHQDKAKQQDTVRVLLDDAVSRAESNSGSDHDSDTSSPATPTKDPASPDSRDWDKADICKKSRQLSPPPLVWQHHPAEQDDVDEGSEEEREDRAAEWIWWLSRQRISSSSNAL